jgi:hypothetical protein
MKLLYTNETFLSIMKYKYDLEIKSTLCFQLLLQNHQRLLILLFKSIDSFCK